MPPFYTRDDGPCCANCVGDSEVVGKCINGKKLFGTEVSGKIGRIQKNLAPLVEKRR